MKTFSVGGAVRDTLLGQTPKDRDYVVVGATVEDMLAMGYRQVGADFPVFLHPETQEEYALARVERKTGKGYNGFAFSTKDVTLEEDLSRRDLTINSMAMAEDGAVVDPFGGRSDLAAKVLRHTTQAFGEDPLRILRVARFFARLGVEWSIAPETQKLMDQMVEAGELDALTPERVWKEFEKGLMEPSAELMLECLCGLFAFDRAPFAEYGWPSNNAIILLQVAAANAAPLPVRFAVSFPRIWSNEEKKRSRIPSEVREVAEGVARLREGCIPSFRSLTPEAKLDLLMRVDALRQKARFVHIVQAYGFYQPADARAVKRAAERLTAVDPSKVIVPGSTGPQVQTQIRAARVSALSTSD